MNAFRIMVAGIVAVLTVFVGTTVQAQDSKKPNILVIWGDDIGVYNISRVNMGVMGYETKNIDRLAAEGMFFTDYYGEQSCTAGRSAFILGQHPIRTGLTKVGIPGANLGIRKEDPTLAMLLKPHGYVSGQFGKNHLGDRDEFLPTNHGFDEFFGNLYHLNAEEEPENDDFPHENFMFRQMFSPRGVIHSYADGRVEDSGALTKKRMQTIDDEFVAGAKKFMDKAVEDDKPFFVWFNSTRMHFFTHPKPEIKGISGQGFYNDAMMEHDGHVGELLDKLEELGVADNTIVIYSTDNGPHYSMWPDAAITPFRSEKNTNWEGAFRVPAIIKWPDKIAPGSVSNEIMSHLDWLPTLMAAAGDNNIASDLRKGTSVGDRSYKVFLDGHNFLPYLTGKTEKGPRRNFIYSSDGGLILGVRQGDWKSVYAQQKAKGFAIWRTEFEMLRIPKLFHLRRDPFERADTDADGYEDWLMRRIPRIMEGAVSVNMFMRTFELYPPRQRANDVSVRQIQEALKQLEVQYDTSM